MNVTRSLVAHVRGRPGRGRSFYVGAAAWLGLLVILLPSGAVSSNFPAFLSVGFLFAGVAGVRRYGLVTAIGATAIYGTPVFESVHLRLGNGPEGLAYVASLAGWILLQAAVVGCCGYLAGIAVERAARRFA